MIKPYLTGKPYVARKFYVIGNNRNKPGNKAVCVGAETDALKRLPHAEARGGHRSRLSPSSGSSSSSSIVVVVVVVAAVVVVVAVAVAVAVAAAAVAAVAAAVVAAACACPCFLCRLVRICF